MKLLSRLHSTFPKQAVGPELALGSSGRLGYILSRRGQALVEALVAISILTTGFLGILTLLSRSLSLNRVVSDNYTATYLAAEGVEIVKNLIDNNRIQEKPWNDGFANGDYQAEYNSLSLSAWNGATLSFDPSINLYTYSGTQLTNFRRRISIELPPGSTDELIVNSVVSWTTRGGGSFEINAEDHFYNWW